MEEVGYRDAPASKMQTILSFFFIRNEWNGLFLQSRKTPTQLLFDCSAMIRKDKNATENAEFVLKILLKLLQIVSLNFFSVLIRRFL